MLEYDLPAHLRYWSLCCFPPCEAGERLYRPPRSIRSVISLYPSKEPCEPGCNKTAGAVPQPPLLLRSVAAFSELRR